MPIYISSECLGFTFISLFKFTQISFAFVELKNKSKVLCWVFPLGIFSSQGVLLRLATFLLADRLQHTAQIWLLPKGFGRPWVWVPHTLLLLKYSKFVCRWCYSEPFLMRKKCTGSWKHISRNFFPSTRTSSSHLQSLSGILSISVVLAKSPLHWEIVTHFTGEQTQCCTNFVYWASDMTRYKSATKVQMKCDMSKTHGGASII